ncbi:MAG: DUF3108 domain-containing protein [Alistipes sp.]
MKQLLFFLLSLLIVTPLSAQLYYPGEVLDYRVSYKASLFPNTEVGSVQVTTTEEMRDGKATYKVRGHGLTLPTYRWFFSINDSYSVWVDRATLQPLRFEADIHEGDYTFYSIYRYNWEQGTVGTEWRRRQEAVNHKTQSINAASMDAISLFFKMRSAESDSFRVGEQQILHMVLQDTIRDIKYKFMGREQKKIRNMGRYKTLKFTCQLGTSEGFSFTDGTEFIIWISDDENKVPLYIESPVRIGSIQAYISGYKGLKYPMKSLIK